MASSGASDGRIKIRKVTDIHSNWSDQGELTDGKFSFQLILDNGAEEAVIMPTNEDSDVLMDLFELSGDIYFDTERKNVIFNSLKIG
ncbi:hypothetical protein [Rubrobacter indicoceani]|uniref:hypothetical protein n=1 Tax=Rubrobacter indicoceani TaxID=2051957 RepID=UPI000E5A50DD|nr:hypothetical protein [Rubrobacter indicoceani]